MYPGDKPHQPLDPCSGDFLILDNLQLLCVTYGLHDVIHVSHKGPLVKIMRTTNIIEKVLSIRKGVLVLKGQYIEQVTISALSENIVTFGGYIGPKRPNHRTSYNTRFENMEVMRLHVSHLGPKYCDKITMYLANKG